MDMVLLIKFSVLQLLVNYIVVESCNNGDSGPQMHISTAPNHLHFGPDSVVLVNRIGIELRIDCWASFPINIEFNGHLSNREIKVNLIKRSPAHQSSTGYCFHINATVESFEEITGNYSCFSVANSSLRTSYYVFHSPNPPASLLNRGQTLIVTNKFEDSVVTIPCPTAIPNVTVHLYNDRGKRINLTKFNIEYNPKVGFIVPKTVNLLGHFQCRTELSEGDKVDIRIVPERKSIAIPQQKFILLREGDPLQLSCLSTEDILIQVELTNPDRKIYRVIGDNHKVTRNTTSSQYKYNLTYITNSTLLREGDTGRGSCWTKSKSELVHEWAFSVRERLATNESNGIELDSYLCHNPANIKLYPCNNCIECNLIKCKRNDRTCSSYECNNVHTFKCLPAGIIQCFNTQNESVQELIYFTGLGRNRSFTNWKLAPTHEILRIQSIRRQGQTSVRAAEESAEDFVPVEVVCEGSAFVIAVGFKWFLRPVRGIETEIPEAHIEHKWRSASEKYILKSTARTLVFRNVTHVVCKAPVWNSTEWIEAMEPIEEWIQWNSTSLPSKAGLLIPVPFCIFIFHTLIFTTVFRF